MAGIPPTISDHTPTAVALDEFLQQQYDYLIVGGGTAGLVLAARLTENPNVHVGIIEAGKLRLGDANIEGMAGGAHMWNNPDYDWSFKTIPQKHNNNHIHHVPRGKFVGGCSGINYMANVRPSTEDIDTWATHAEGWSWATLESYYRKSETLQPDNATRVRPSHFSFNPNTHGTSGPIQTSWPPSIPPLDPIIANAFNEAASTSGPKDPYGGDHLGFGQHAFTIDRRNGIPTRSYAVPGYFLPCSSRPNLQLLSEATVIRVLIDDQAPQDLHPTATGVEIRYRDQLYSINVEQEVILSASTIQSPRLLELSGIGNREILLAAGIKCRVNLPDVGENLLEHTMTAITYETVGGSGNETLDSLALDQDFFNKQLDLLTKSHDGLMAGALGLIGFISYASQVPPERLRKTIDGITTEAANRPSYRKEYQRVQRLLKDDKAPAIELIALPAYVDVASAAKDQSKFLPGPIPGHNACYSFLVAGMYPISRGSTHIEKVDTPLLANQSQIDFDMLSSDADVDVIAAGLTFADRAFKSKHLTNRFLKRVHPPLEVDLEDPAQARAYVQENIMMFNHNAGTCAMGRVVDERLRVKGVQRLRVVDVSVIPDHISANPMATVYALAERAAALIKEDNTLLR